MNDSARNKAEPGMALKAPLVQFYTPATAALLERRPRTLKHAWILA